MPARDLTLAEYARVQAHVGERYPLAEVLSHLGVTERRWSHAQQTWLQRFAKDPSLNDAFVCELDRAVDALERRVRPIDDDAAAWLTFFAAYSRQMEPVAWLERQDLTLNDLARLERLWERRCRDDGDVARRFAELKKDAGSRPLAAIVADPRKPLRPGSPPSDAATDAAEYTAPEPAVAGPQLRTTAAMPDAPLARALPFVGASAAAAAPAGAPAQGGSTGEDSSPVGPRVVTSLLWRGGDGRLRTTIVGKLTVYLQAGAPPVVGPSDPLVAFDRIAADRRFVDEASEMAPWTMSASIITYGGPLRFTFYPTSGEPLQITAAPGAPVGRSMSNPERAWLARKPLTRGQDGILTISDEIDGRYFVATPPEQHTTKIVGDERVVLEVGGARFDTRLPAIVIVLTVDIGGRRSLVTLPFDMLAVHGDRRRIALIGRATMPAETTLVGHALAPLYAPASPDAAANRAARPPRGGSSVRTASFTDPLAGSRPATPFESRHTASEPNVAPPAPPPAATPQVGYAQERARETVEAAIPRADGAAIPVGVGEAAPRLIEPRSPTSQPAPAAKPAIARPKPGAMAKPRVKKR